MVRIYLDLETFRPKRENAFIEEKIISAGLLIDETPYNEYSLGQKIDPVIISEWKGLNECQIVAKVQDKIKEALLTHNFTVLSGYGILRFDIPLLISRCVQNSMGDINVVTKLWHDCITIDHIQQLLAANGNSFKGASLDNVIATAKRLGLNPPPHNGDCLGNAKDGFVIVIYTEGTAERDTLKSKLHSIGFTSIPYRRGCKAFETKFGHWKQWYPGDA